MKRNNAHTTQKLCEAVEKKKAQLSKEKWSDEFKNRLSHELTSIEANGWCGHYYFTHPKTLKDYSWISALLHGTDTWENNGEELIEKGMEHRW